VSNISRDILGNGGKAVRSKVAEVYGIKVRRLWQVIKWNISTYTCNPLLKREIMWKFSH